MDILHPKSMFLLKGICYKKTVKQSINDGIFSGNKKEKGEEKGNMMVDLKTGHPMENTRRTKCVTDAT